MKRKMTDNQKQFIIENYANMDAKEIAKILEVEAIQVYKFAASKGIKKETTRSDSKFSVEQKQFVLDNYATMSNAEISHKTNLDRDTIQRIARLNNIKKNKAFGDHFGLSYNKRRFIMKNSKCMTASEIGEVLNIPANKVTKFCNSVNLELKEFDGVKMGGKLSIKQKKFILDNYKTMSNKDICKELNIDIDTLHNYSSSSKLVKDIEFCHNKAGYIEVLLNNRNRIDYNVYDYLGKDTEQKVDNLYKSKYGKYEVNQNYFSVIDNEFKAYWLGFLYADGCVRLNNSNGKKTNSLSLGLASIDIEHIQKFRDSIQATNKIEHKEHLGGKYHSDRITITNAKICEDLNELGCTPRKSLTLTFPSCEQMPNNMVRHFIRGYFDGDGCIHINLNKRTVSLSFIGTKDFLNTMQDILCNELNITKTKMQDRKDNKALSIMWGDIYSIEKIYKYLYKDCNIYLDRKLKKFDILYCLD